MVFMIMKVLYCLRVIKDVYLGLKRTANITLAIGDKSKDDYRDGYPSQEICGFRIQESSHSSFNNHGEIFEGDGIGGYWYQTRHYSSHNLGGCGRLFCLSVASHHFHENFHSTKEVIVVVMMKDQDLGIKRPSTFPFRIMDKVLMVMG